MQIRVSRYIQPLLLPVVLAALFVIQNLAFNNWLGFNNHYLGRFLAVNFSLGLVLYCPSLFFGKRGRYAYLFLISCTVSLLLVSQFLYFEYSQSFLQASALKYIGQAASVTGTVKSLLSGNLLLFIANIFLVAGVAILVWAKKFNRNEVSLLPREKIIVFLCIAALASSGYWLVIQKEKQEWGGSSRLYLNAYDVNALVEKIGIANFFLEDSFKYLARVDLVSAADKNFLADWIKSQQPETAKPASAKGYGEAKGKNVIFLQIESLENAVINRKIDGQEITPNINKASQEGLYFSNYYTQVGPGNTADAEFSTLNSLYPLPDDVVFIDYAHNYYNALPKLFTSHGYSAYALNGDVPTFWNRSNVYPNLGYQEKISEDSYIKSRPIGKGPSSLGDEDFLLQSLPKLESFKQPFFSVLITESSHTPFELPEDLQTLDMSGPAAQHLNYTQQQYLESIHYMDKAIGEFIESLKQAGLYNNSVIAIYGDHQSFTGISDPLDAGDATFPALKHSQVPLLILNSGIKPAEITTPASHLDLFPTIMNMLGIQPPKDILGQDVLNAKNPVVVRRNLSSGTINTILGNTLAFIANENGVFEDGTCLKMPVKTAVPVANCRALFDRQSNSVKASDIIIRGNLLDKFGS